MGWYYLFSNTRLLQFLEKHRDRFYLVLNFFLVTQLSLLVYFFQLSSKLPITVLLWVASFLLLNGVNYFFKNQLSWLSSRVYLTLAPVIAPRIELRIISLLNPSNLEGMIFWVLFSLILIILWGHSEIGSFPSLKTFIDIHGDSSFLKTLWQIDAAVVTVTFISVTFIFELLRSGESIAAKTFSFVVKKILYKEILLVNIIALIPLGISTFVDKDGNSWTVLFAGLSLWIFCITIFSTIYLLMRLIRLVEPSEVIQTTNKALEGIIKKAIVDEMFHRLAGNLLMNSGEKEGYVGLGSDYRDDLYPIRLSTEKKLLVSDVKIGAIPRVVKQLKKSISSKGEKIIITKQIGYVIEPDDDVLARLHEDDYSENIEKQVRKLYKTREQESTYKEDIGGTFDLIRDQAVAAISKGAKANLSMSLDNFYLALEIIYSSLLKIGARFDFKTSREAFLETRSMVLIQNNLREVIGEAMKSQNKDLIADVLYFPIRMMRLAMQNRDHLLFKQAVYLYYNAYLLYKQHYKADDSLIVDRVWRHLKEFGDYELGRKFNHLMESDEDKELVAGYVTETLLVLQHVIKTSIDYSDTKAFAEFMNGFEKMFKYLTRDFRSSEHDIHIIELDLRREKNVDRKTQHEVKLAIAKRVAEIDKLLAQHKQSIKFGLGAWLLRCILVGRTKRRFGIENLPKFYALGSFKDIYELYFSIDKRSFKDVYGWHWWDSDQLDDEEAHWLDDSWLEEFYCIAAIKAIGMLDNVNLVALPTPEDNEYFSSGGLNHIKEQLQKQIQKIRENIGNYEGIVTADELVKGDVLIQAHEKGSEAQKKNEEQRLIDAKLEKDAIEKFREEFIKAWSENVTVRKLFEDKNAFVDETTVILRGRRAHTLGYNRLELKELFIANSSKDYSGFGSHYGSSMGQSEDVRFFNEIYGEMKQKQNIISVNIVEELEERIRVLRRLGYHCDAILVSSWKITEQLHRSKKFLPKWQVPEKSSLHGLDGFFLRIPIFQISGPGDEERAILIDFKKFGRIRQLRVDKKTDGYFKFSVEPMTEELFSSIVSNNPDILIDKKSGSQKNRDEVYREYQKRVHLRVFQRVKIEVRDVHSGMAIEVSNTDDNN
jgi:hypothetical protein